MFMAWGRISGPLKGVSVFYLADHLHGSVAAILDKSQTVKISYEYDLFGIPCADSPCGDSLSIPDRFLFAGEDYEVETGLIYLRNQYLLGIYLLPTGRFENVRNRCFSIALLEVLW